MSQKSGPEPRDEETGLPGFKTWRGVYCFVLASFLLWLVLLVLLGRVFQ